MPDDTFFIQDFPMGSTIKIEIEIEDTVDEEESDSDNE